MKIRPLKLAILIGLFFYSHQVLAQAMAGIFSPHGSFTQLSGDSKSFPDYKEWGTSFSQTIFRGETHQVNLSGTYRDLHFDQTPVHPKRLETLEGGLQYTYHMEQNRSWSVQASYGSASDQLFEDREVSTLSANLIFRASERWIILANYSNNRSFLNNIPLPSVMYAHTMTRDKTLLIGIPFFFYRTPLSESFSFSYSTIIPYTHRLALTYSPSVFVRFSVGAEQEIETFLRYQRLNRDDRLFLVRRTAYFGIQTGYKRNLTLDFRIGHAFGQRYFEAESYSKRSQNIQELEDGLFTSFNAEFRF